MNYTITLEISGGTDDSDEASLTAIHIFNRIFPAGEFGGLAQLESVTVVADTHKTIADRIAERFDNAGLTFQPRTVHLQTLCEPVHDSHAPGRWPEELAKIARDYGLTMPEIKS